MNTAQAMGLAAMLLAALAARGREVYVDYEGGSDDADGLTPQTPFKHCPGDAAAAGKAKALALAAGDRAIFKGGVEYRSVVTIPWSGAEGQPIVYDGNTAGGFGTGMAIVQCGEPVGGWKKVASADEVRGHPNWERLYVTTLDKARGFFTFSLYEGATYLNCAQDPDPEIPFFHDRLKNYRNTKTATGSSVTDAAYFTQSDARFFDGAYVSLHVKPNVLTYRAVSGYEPGTHTLSFKPHGKETYGGARGHNYSILNCIHFLNRPGEYWLDERPDGVRLVLWPHRPGAGGPEGVTISERKNGFVLQDASHVTIEGFRILQFGGNRAAAIAKSGGLSRGLVIRGNEIARGRTYPSRSGAILLGDVEHSLIEANHIHENAYCAGLMLSRFNDSTARRNLLVRNGSTAVDYYDCHRSTLLHNVVRDNLGMHANGLTLYLGCSEILVEGNEVYGSNVGLTMQDGKDITVRNNIFDGNGGLCIGLWSGKPLVNVAIVNNVLFGAGRDWQAAIYGGNKGASGYTIRNNILDGVSGTFPADTQWGHNLWTHRGPNFPGEKDGDRFEADLGRIFNAHEAEDFRLKPDSPALDGGAKLDRGADLAGTPAPQGDAADMGALEYAADAPRYPGGRADAMPYAPLTPNEKAQGPKHEGSSLAPRPSVLPAPAASRAPAAAEHAAPSGPDREAARKLEANLRELIVEASKQAGGEAVFVELDGRMQRGKLISADANGIAVQVGANRLPLPWAFVTPRSLYGLARPFVKDAGLLGRYCRAMGLDREAEALELAFAEGRR